MARWRRRDAAEDAPTAHRRARPLSGGVAWPSFGTAACPSLVDLLGSLREGLPGLGRSALHRRLRRNGVSRPPKPEGGSKRGRPPETRTGRLHTDAAEPRTAEGRTHLLLAVDRVSKLLRVGLRDRVAMADGAAFMARAAVALPCGVHAVLTDNGATVAHSPHVLDRACREHGVERRLTKPHHPWTNGRPSGWRGASRRPPSGASTTTRRPTRRPTPGPMPPPTASAGARSPCGGAALPGDLPRLEGGPLAIQGRSAPPHREAAHLGQERVEHPNARCLTPYA